MQRKTIEKWRQFQLSHADVASRICELILPACEILHGKDPEEQARLLETHKDCAELLQLLRSHKNEFALQDDTYAFMAFIFKLCYCAVMKAEQGRQGTHS